MVLIQGKKSRNKYWYDEEKLTLTDKEGNCIKIYEPLDGISENNLRLYVDDLFANFYKLVNGFKYTCEADKINKIDWV